MQVMIKIKPSFIVQGEHGPYLLRWYLTPWSGWLRGPQKNKIRTVLGKAIRLLPNVYLHKFVHDDPDRALHCHPWGSCSIILSGGYREITPEGEFQRRAGGIHFRGAKAAHRVVLYRDVDWDWHFHPDEKIRPAWTLFITGPKIRDWGFHCPKGWVPWWEFVNPKNPGEVGRGCD